MAMIRPRNFSFIFARRFMGKYALVFFIFIIGRSDSGLGMNVLFT